MRRAVPSVGFGTLCACTLWVAACGTAKPASKNRTSDTPEAPAAEATEVPVAKSTVPPGAVDLSTLDLNAPTFERDVKPLTAQVCVPCHVPYGYAQTVKESKANMVAVLESGRMPPKSSDWQVPEADVEKYRAALVKALKNLK